MWVPRRLPFLSLLLALAACSGPVAGTTPRPLGKASSSVQGIVGVAASPNQDDGTRMPWSPAVPSGLPASPLASGASALPQGALVGQVFAPAGLLAAAGILSNHGSGLIANNSGSLISDAGGGLITNNGASYRLLALERQVAASEVLVVLVDAAGKPILDAQGQPRQSRSDAQGRYAFASVPPQHAIAQVDLGAMGTLAALVVPGMAQANLDVSSSLVASYVLSQYVSTQAKPVDVLARLPADVAMATQQKAVLALQKGVVPNKLDSATVSGAVAALRQGDAAFDAQMEVVKRLLLAAGVADLGAGRPATDVFMGRIDRVLPGGPGGLVALYTPNDYRIWGLSSDGILLNLVGSGMERTAQGAGQAIPFVAQAKEADLGYMWGMAWDSQQRLWVLEDQVGLWRLEGAARRMLLTWDQMKAAMGGEPSGAFALGAGDLFWQVSQGQVFRWKEGEASPTSAGAAPGMMRAMDLAALPDGSLLHRRFDEFKHLAAGSFAASPLMDLVASGVRATVAGNRNDFALDSSGNVLFVNDADGRVHAWRPGGLEQVGPLRAGLRAGLFTSAVDAAGRFYAVDVDSNESEEPSILRMGQGNGPWERVAGRDAYPNDFSANGEFSLQGPSGLDVESDGTMWITDHGALLKVRPAGGGSEVVLPSGSLVGGLPVQITGVRLLGGGRLALRVSGSSQERFAERAADGSLNVIASAAKGAANLRHSTYFAWDAHPVQGWAWAQFNQASFPDTTVAIWRRKPGAVANEMVVPTSAGIAEAIKLRVAADGAIWILGRSQADRGLKRWVWTEAGALKEAPENAAFPDAVDAQGRVYEGGAPTYTLGDARPRKIWRQASGGPPVVVAGPGTALLPGPNLDEGIGSAADLRFDGDGSLYYRDPRRRIVRRIPGDRLPP